MEIKNCDTFKLNGIVFEKTNLKKIDRKGY